MFLGHHRTFDLNIVPPSVSGQLPLELPLHLACQYLQETTVDDLLDAGAKPESFCGHGCNALQCATYADVLDSKLVSRLTKCFESREAKKDYINSPNQAEDLRTTHYIARSPNQRLEGAFALDELEVDWTLKDRGKNTPYELAARHGNWKITSYLASKQWGKGSNKFKTSDEFKTTVEFKAGSKVQVLVCQWTQVNVQNVSMKSTLHYSVACY